MIKEDEDITSARMSGEHRYKKETTNVNIWDKGLLKLKQILAAQDHAAKLTALTALIKMIEENVKVSKRLIESDILIALCVDTNVNRRSLAKKTFHCLKLLMQCETFVTSSYASYPLEFIVRLLGTSLKANCKENALTLVLEHLLRVLARLDEVPKVFERVVGGKTTVQIVKEIDNMFRRSPTYAFEMLIVGGEVLPYILNGNVIDHNQIKSCVNDLAQVLKNVYEKLSSCVNLNVLLPDAGDELAERNSARAVELLAHIGICAISFCGQAHATECETSATMTATDKQSIAFDVLQTIRLKPTQFVLKVFVNVLNMDMYCHYFGCLRALYRVPALSQECVTLSHKLATSGILRLIPLVAANCTHNKRAVALKCMAEVLACLAKDTFSLDDYPGGFSGLRARLLDGIRHLHKDTSKWFEGLKAAKASTSHQQTIIIFSYFFKLTPKESEDERSLQLLPLLTSYLNQMYLKAQYQITPAAITKALWLTFAICTIEEKPQKIEAERATNMLLRLLAKHDLRVVHTTHPAILYWCFSCSKIPSAMKKNLLIFWFEETSPAKDEVLIQLMLKHHSAGSCLLEIIQSVQDDVAAQALKIVQQAIDRQEENGKKDLLLMLCKNIPYVLTNVSIKKSVLSLENVGVLLNIVHSGIGQDTSSAGALTTMTQLMGILVGAQLDAPLIFYSSIIHQLFQLLLSSMMDNDERILVAYLHNAKFLEILQSAISSMDPVLVTKVHNILSYMLHFQITKMIMVESTQVFINVRYLLKYLEFKEQHLVTATLKMTIILLQEAVTPIKFPFITFSKMTATETIHFLQDLSVAITNTCLTFQTLNPGISSLSVVCLHAMMQYAAKISKLVHNHIAQGPWMTWFLARYVSVTANWCSHEFLRFVCEWLPQHQCSSKCISNCSVGINHGSKTSVKTLCNDDNDLLTKAVSSLATAFIKADISETNKKLAQQAIKGLLLTHISLPKIVIEHLEEKLLSIDQHVRQVTPAHDKGNKSTD